MHIITYILRRTQTDIRPLLSPASEQVGDRTAAAGRFIDAVRFAEPVLRNELLRLGPSLVGFGLGARLIDGFAGHSFGQGLGLLLGEGQGE